MRREVQDAIVRQRRLRDLTQVRREVSGLQRGLARRERRDGVGLVTRERQAGRAWSRRARRCARHARAASDPGSRASPADAVAEWAVTRGSDASNTGSANTASARGASTRWSSRRRTAATIDADGAWTISWRATSAPEPVGQPGKRHLLKAAWRDDQQALAGGQGAEGIEQQRAQRGGGRARSGTLRARRPAGRRRRRDRGAAVLGGGFDRRTRGEPVRRERPLRHDPGVARGLAEHVLDEHRVGIEDLALDRVGRQRLRAGHGRGTRRLALQACFSQTELIRQLGQLPRERGRVGAFRALRGVGSLRLRVDPLLQPAQLVDRRGLRARGIGAHVHHHLEEASCPRALADLERLSIEAGRRLRLVLRHQHVDVRLGTPAGSRPSSPRGPASSPHVRASTPPRRRPRRPGDGRRRARRASRPRLA